MLETIQDVKAEMHTLKEKIEAESERGEWTQRLQRTREELKNLADVWEYMTDLERRNVLREAIEEIELTHEDIKIKCYIEP